MDALSKVLEDLTKARENLRKANRMNEEEYNHFKRIVILLEEQRNYLLREPDPFDSENRLA